jgi:hypothetical protein
MRDWSMSVSAAPDVERRRIATARMMRLLGTTFVLATAGAVPACTESDTPAVDRERTSEEYVRAGMTDTVFLRRLRTVESISRRIDADSLARLYARALDAPSGEMVGVASAIGCQYYLIIKQYGYPALTRARTRVLDSLLAIPGNRARWEASAARWPQQSLGMGDCDAGAIVSLPDSVTREPRVPVVPLRFTTP